MNRRRNVSHPFNSKMVVADHSLQRFHFPRRQKKDFGPQGCEDTVIILLAVDFTQWPPGGCNGGKPLSAIIYHEQGTEFSP